MAINKKQGDIFAIYIKSRNHDQRYSCQKNNNKKILTLTKMEDYKFS